jgi:UDP-N-acetylmuramoyl-tripeptide--D-alanyl-D-alanine ligase
MDAVYTAEDLIEITKGRLAAGLTPEDAGAICSDTRLMEGGEWFIALAGKNFDGHDFIGDAFAGGAVGAIVEERPSYPIANPNFPLIAVDDTLFAYHRVARNWRKRISPQVVLCSADDESAPELLKELEKVLCSKGKEVLSMLAVGVDETKFLDEVLAMSAVTEYFLCVLSPKEYEAVSRLTHSLEPNVLVVMRGALDNFRLTHSQSELSKTKRDMFDAMSKTKSTAIVADLFPDALYATAQGNSKKIRVYPGAGRTAASNSSEYELDCDPDVANLSAEGRWCLDQVLSCLEPARS